MFEVFMVINAIHRLMYDGVENQQLRYSSVWMAMIMDLSRDEPATDLK